MSETKPVTIIPACYLSGNKWYDTEREDYFLPEQPVYVRIGGKRREAIRCKWLWRLVARVQGWLY